MHGMETKWQGVSEDQTTSARVHLYYYPLAMHDTSGSLGVQIHAIQKMNALRTETCWGNDT